MARRVRGSLAAIVSEAQERGLVASTTCGRLASASDSRREQPRRKCRQAELKAIIDAGTLRVVRPLILTAIFTGLRGSNAWAEVEDVDLRAGEIHIRRRVDRYNKFGPPKSRPAPATFRSPGAVNALREW